MPPRYPLTRLDDVEDDYHGTVVRDPYRWLEQSVDEPEVRAWIEAQNELCRSYLAEGSEAAALRRRLAELFDYPRRSAPFRRGDRYFQFRNPGLSDQDSLFVTSRPDEEGRLLLDPNRLADDGRVSLTSVAVSPQGAYLAYGTSEAGSDWITWRVRDVKSGRDLPDTLRWSRFCDATWLPGGDAFLYLRYPEPAAGQELLARLERPELLLHRLGTSQADDKVVASNGEQPRWSFSPAVSDDQRYLVITIHEGTDPRTMVVYRELDGDGALHSLIGSMHSAYAFLGNDGERFYFLTDHRAARRRVVAIDLGGAADERVLVPERSDTLLEARLLGDTLVALYQRHASHRLLLFDLAGRELGEIPLPSLGSVELGRSRRQDGELFFRFSSFLEPGSILRWQAGRAQAEPLWRPALPFDASPYLVRQEFAASRDGTRVPMFLVHRRDQAADGDAPTLLYGYGGFDVSLNPSFSPSRLAFLERGGVLAVANLRGGGEYGSSWHEAGTRERKQNVFDDFVACAEHLVALGLTRPERLAIQGGSNGGLLVGACLCQRPELFGAAHAAVGVLDMLRYHHFTIGWAWASDYGTAEEPEEFRVLRAYSPLHNLEPGRCYPATLLTTGDHDDRVVPAHSFKFAAALQAAQGCDRPILLRVETRAGHGHGKPTSVVIEEQADVWAFLLRELGAGKRP